MAVDRSKIEWTDATWSPVRGCSRVSAGCDNCYAARQAHRFSGAGQPYEGLTTIRNGKVDWTGRVRLVTEMLDAPLRWRKPRRIFVNSMSDLFHDSLTDEQIVEVFGVMAVAAQPFGGRYVRGRGWINQRGPHIFQVLTKRAQRMRSTLASWKFRTLVSYAARRWAHDRVDAGWLAQCISGVREPGNNCTLDQMWPLPNMWAGVSCEDQERADERWNELSQIPAAVRFLSLEPLLGGITMEHWATLPDWVILGSESGPGARPMNLAWAESIRDQCAAAGVPLFVKQIANKQDRKGSNPEFWPKGPWPREFPRSEHA